MAVSGLSKNVSKTLSQTQRKYSQIHKKALAIIFALTKFHHFLYGRKFISSEVWHRIGRPSIEKVQETYQLASKHKLPVLGSLNLNTKGSDSSPISIKFIEADVPDLNILGRNAIRQLNISVDDLLLKEDRVHKLETKNNAQTSKDKPSVLLKACEQLYGDFFFSFLTRIGRFERF